MKITIYSSLVVIGLGFFSRYSIQNQECSFLKNLNFKNGSDTVVIKAKYEEIHRVVVSKQLRELDHKKLLKLSDFKYNIGFTPEGCQTPYTAVSRDSSSTALSLFNENYSGRKVVLTCIAYEGYSVKSDPFFIVDKIELERK